MCAAFSPCCAIWARGWTCRASSTTTAARNTPITPTTSSTTNASRASAHWRVGAGGRPATRARRRQPGPAGRYIENGGFFVEHIPERRSYYKPWNMAYQDWAVEMGIFDSPQPYLFQLYVEPMRKFQLAAEGHGERQPPEHLRERIKATWTRCRSGIEPFETGERGIPVHALTQRPMAMYHSWGSQNAWLRQIHGRNPLYLPTKLMRTRV